MSIDVSVPGGDPAQPGFAVQRTGGRLCIAAGRIAQDTSLFGVTNDQNGPQMNVYPVPAEDGTGFPPEGARSNLIPNPQFADNITDFWNFSNFERDTSPTGQDGAITIPLDFVAVAHFTGATGTYVDLVSDPATLDPHERDYFFKWYMVRQEVGDTTWMYCVDDLDNEVVASYSQVLDGTDFSVMSRHLRYFTLADEATTVTVKLRIYNTNHDLWMVGCELVPQYERDMAEAYGDGTREGWTWGGDAHNSVSWET